MTCATAIIEIVMLLPGPMDRGVSCCLQCYSPRARGVSCSALRYTVGVTTCAGRTVACAAASSATSPGHVA